MSDHHDAARFRARARECRGLTETARDGGTRDDLLRIATELEQEADMIEAANKPECAG